jgi:hypothetical protein
VCSEHAVWEVVAVGGQRLRDPWHVVKLVAIVLVVVAVLVVLVVLMVLLSSNDSHGGNVAATNIAAAPFLLIVIRQRCR